MSDIIKAQQGLARHPHKQTRHIGLMICITCYACREWIEEALQHVLTNDGSQTPGVDGMSWKNFNDAEKK